MCKIMAIAGIKPEHIEKVHKLAKAAAKQMSFAETDGVGYAAITNYGSIYGEKWLKNDDAFVIHSQPKPDPVTLKMQTMFGGMADWVTPPVKEKVYSSFGTRTQHAVDSTVAMILHARKASPSSDKTVENVHPFVTVDVADQPDTAIIHNGVINNHMKLTKKMSTCDSEVILHEYLGNMMFHNPWGIEQVAKTLVGEYAVAVLSSMTNSDGSLTPILDVFKSGKELFAAYIPELDNIVFCTTEYTLKNACEEVGLTIKMSVKIKDGNLLRLDAITGEKIDEVISFKTSATTESAFTESHKHSMGTATQVDDSIETAKGEFERKHPSLFTKPYAEPGNLLKHEQELFTELKKNQTTNHKALHLVSVGLAAMTQSRA